jgi:hypothetical protein
MSRRRRNHRHTPPAVIEDPSAVIRRRVQRLRQKGEYRKAAVDLRKLAGMTGEARTWVALGAMLMRARRDDDALDALKQGMWLHAHNGAKARARSVARLILQLDPFNRRALALAV